MIALYFLMDIRMFLCVRGIKKFSMKVCRKLQRHVLIRIRKGSRVAQLAHREAR